MIDNNVLDAGVDAALPRGLDELAQMVAIPSVAAQGSSPMVPCAERVADLLRARGLEARLVPTDGGPPVVFAEDRSAGVDAPTVLFYNHYDVQPAEPLDLWDSPPFELSVRDGIAYGRGTSDDKGHITCRLMALDALRAANNGRLPVNVKVVIEGEEEVSSVHLPAWIEANANVLHADVCLWEFGGVDEGGHPEIICGLRGIAYFELRVKTIAYDAHSGLGGSLFPNAAWRLVWALSTLKDADERILLPGHYDVVKPATDYDLELLAALPSQEAWLKREYGVEQFLGGATGVEYQRRAVFEPTCTICGLRSGYQGQGAKTVLPSQAMAKVDFRLVPDQDPETVRHALRAHLDAHGFDDVEVVYLGGQRPARVDPRHPMVTLCARIAREVYGTEPSLIPLVGGSGPIHPFVVGLRQPVVTCGCGYPGARAHAPNENLRLSDLVLGARHTARFLAALAAGEGGLQGNA
uniref:Acetylornithine deacetylase/Succinyl-diaminopimelate desuccinylase and related deacylases n=1 Tax=uncultured Armatimonadetes bacterium TaxID=157466 RepID=A0A6J4HWD8_9BACT|nr:Acetylornithine deacetylase/Succinyl-diaminopimelate desuccinylase and related deacylases [uncultured Armatimonadetes bacterium]